MNLRRALCTPTLSFVTTVALAILAPAACSSSASDTADGGKTGGDAATNGEGGSLDDGGVGNDGATTGDASIGGGPVIFVIPMENKGQAQIYGDMVNAPYINKTLLVAYPHTENLSDELPSLVSEPHYVWMESGTNAFPDRTFTNDNDPSASNSTNSTAHLVAQLDTAGISWTSYQEGITAGTCPIASIGGTNYAAKHNPFVFFQDVVGNPPSAANANCIAHHKTLAALTTDLQGGKAARYNFVTPNQCNDMHGGGGCAALFDTDLNIKAGDDWLKANLQPIIDYALARNGYVFITWDEGDSTNLVPTIAISKKAIAGHVGTVAYTHSSLLKSEEEIFGVPVLMSVRGANDFSDLFTSFP